MTESKKLERNLNKALESFQNATSMYWYWPRDCYPASICEFRGDYAFLSNFYVEPDGSHVEGEYQRLKTLDQNIADKFLQLGPREAKRLGRKISLRHDWNNGIAEIAMLCCLAKKYHDWSFLFSALQGTKCWNLVEGNNWGDDTWGATLADTYLWGKNKLGLMHMWLRSQKADDLRTIHEMLKERLTLPTRFPF